MRFFNARISQDQFRSGLASAAIGIGIIVPVLAGILIAHQKPSNWTDVLGACASLAITAAYVGAKVLAARRGKITLSPSVAFVLTCVTCVTVVFGYFATYRWSGEVLIAVLVLPLIFFAVIGDNWMLLAGWLATAAAMALCLRREHLPPDVYAARLLIYVSLAAIAALMIAPAIRKLHHRFTSRDALSALTQSLAEAESVEAALQECIPAVCTVIPCRSAALYVRADEPVALEEVVVWHRDGGVAQRPPLDEVPAPATLATGARVVGSRCYLSAGYSNAGALLLVIDGIDTRKVSPFFAQEAASGLSSSLLLTTARLAYVSTLREESRTDALTGLANRRALEERLELVTAQSSRSGAPLTVALIDLDHFKAFNDQSGHHSGDELLRRLSDTLARRLRAQDLLARYGGEEFCVVLPDTDLFAARVVLEDLRASAPGVQVDGRSATISVGLAEWLPGETTEGLLQRADRALYLAKEQGRDRVVAADRASVPWIATPTRSAPPHARADQAPAGDLGSAPRGASPRSARAPGGVVTSTTPSGR